MDNKDNMHKIEILEKYYCINYETISFFDVSAKKLESILSMLKYDDSFLEIVQNSKIEDSLHILKSFLDET